MFLTKDIGPQPVAIELRNRLKVFGPPIFFGGGGQYPIISFWCSIADRYTSCVSFVKIRSEVSMETILKEATFAKQMLSPYRVGGGQKLWLSPV